MKDRPWWQKTLLLYELGLEDHLMRGEGRIRCGSEGGMGPVAGAWWEGPEGQREEVGENGSDYWIR